MQNPQVQNVAAMSVQQPQGSGAPSASPFLFRGNGARALWRLGPCKPLVPRKFEGLFAIN